MNKNFTHNYIKCPECKNEINLSLIDKTCSNPLCNFDFNGLSELLILDDYKLKQALAVSRSAKNKNEIKLIEVAIQYNMADYLSHFIECTWGAHYNSLYKDFIKPYLNDLNVLKTVLTSNIIKTEKNGVIVSDSGYKMFWILYKYLIKINNEEIKTFLKTEFKVFWDKLNK